MFFDTGLVATELVYTTADASVGLTDSTAEPSTEVVFVTCACLLVATIESMNLRYWKAKSPVRYLADLSPSESMFSGVYDHNVVIALAAVRATFSLVSTSARLAITGCAVAARNAPLATKSAAAASFSRLPAGRCGTRTGSSTASGSASTASGSASAASASADSPAPSADSAVSPSDSSATI